MIGTGMRHLKGSITPKLSDKMVREFHRHWEFQTGARGVPHAHLATDGETFAVEYADTWDENSLKHTVELMLGKAVNLAALKSPPRNVTYSS
jgi:hypothetical protein